MEANAVSTSYTHIHFAFATLTPEFAVDLGGQTVQWELFVGMTSYKRIVSFGGWDFSTDPSTYNIFREAVLPTNIPTVVQNIASFVEQVRVGHSVMRAATLTMLV